MRRKGAACRVVLLALLRAVVGLSYDLGQHGAHSAVWADRGLLQSNSTSNFAREPELGSCPTGLSPDCEKQVYESSCGPQQPLEPLNFKPTTREVLLRCLFQCATSNSSALRPLRLQFPVNDLSSAGLMTYLANVYAQAIGVPISLTALTYQQYFYEQDKYIIPEFSQSNIDAFALTAGLLGEADAKDGLVDIGPLLLQDPNTGWLNISAVARGYLSVFNSKVLALPLSVTMPLLTYRLDLFTKLNLTVPATWDELVDLATRMNGIDTNNDGKPDFSICAWDPRVISCPGANATLAYIATSYIQTDGPSQGLFMDPSGGRFLWNSPAMAKAMQVFGALSALNPSTISDPAGLCQTPMRLFAAGRCLMQLGEFLGWKLAAYHTNSLAGNIGLAPAPGSTEVLDRVTWTLRECDQDLCPLAEVLPPASERTLPRRGGHPPPPAPAPPSPRPPPPRPPATAGGNGSNTAALPIRLGSAREAPAATPSAGSKLLNRPQWFIPGLVGINSRTNTMYQLYALAGITWFALFSNPASATYNINSYPIRASDFSGIYWQGAGYNADDLGRMIPVYASALHNPNIAVELRTVRSSTLMHSLTMLMPVALSIYGNTSNSFPPAPITTPGAASTSLPSSAQSTAPTPPRAPEQQVAAAMAEAEAQWWASVADLPPASFLANYRQSINWVAPPPPSPPPMPVALVDGLPPPYEAPSPRPPVAVILAVILPVVGAAVIIALGTWAVNRAYARGLIIRPVPPPVTNLEDVTILITDVQNSTPLWEAMPEIMDKAICMHYTCLRRIASQHQGYVFAEEGDSLSIAFPKVSAALSFSTSGQLALASLNYPSALLSHPACHDIIMACKFPPQQRTVRDLLSMKRGTSASLTPSCLGGTSPSGNDSYTDALRHTGVGLAERRLSTVEGWAWDKSLVALQNLTVKGDRLHERGKPHSPLHPRANSSRAKLHSFIRSATGRQTGGSLSMPRRHASHSMGDKGHPDHIVASKGGIMEASATGADRPSSPEPTPSGTASTTFASTTVPAKGVPPSLRYSTVGTRSSLQQAVPEEEPMLAAADLRTASGSGMRRVHFTDHMEVLAPRTHSLPGHTFFHSADNMAHYTASMHLRGHHSRFKHMRPPPYPSSPPQSWTAARSSGAGDGPAMLPAGRASSRSMGVLGSRRFSSATGVTPGRGTATTDLPGAASLGAAGTTLSSHLQGAVMIGRSPSAVQQAPLSLAPEHNTDPTSFFMSQDPRVSSSRAARSTVNATGASSMSASQLLALVLQASGRLNSGGQAGALVPAGSGSANFTSASASFRGATSPRGSEGVPNMSALRTAFASGNLRTHTASRAGDGWGGMGSSPRFPSCTQLAVTAAAAGGASMRVTSDSQSPASPGRAVSRIVLPDGMHAAVPRMYGIGVSSGEESGGSSHKPSPSPPMSRQAAGLEVQRSRHSSITAGSDRSVHGTSMMLMRSHAHSPPRAGSHVLPGPWSTTTRASWGAVPPSTPPAAGRQSGSSAAGPDTSSLQAAVKSGTTSERASPRGLASWRGTGASLALQLHSSPSSASLGAADAGPDSLHNRSSKGAQVQGPGSHSSQTAPNLHLSQATRQVDPAAGPATGSMRVDETTGVSEGSTQGHPEPGVMPEVERPTTRSHSLLTRHTLPPKVPRSQPSASNLGNRAGLQQQQQQQQAPQQQSVSQQLASVSSTVQTPPPLSPAFARLTSTERSSFASSAFGAGGQLSMDGTAAGIASVTPNLRSTQSIGQSTAATSSAGTPAVEGIVTSTSGWEGTQGPEPSAPRFQPALTTRPSDRDTPWLVPGSRPASLSQAPDEQPTRVLESHEIQAYSPPPHADHSRTLLLLQPSHPVPCPQPGEATQSEAMVMPAEQSIGLAASQPVEHALPPLQYEPVQPSIQDSGLTAVPASDTGAAVHSTLGPGSNSGAALKTAWSSGKRPPPAPVRTRSRTSLHQAASSLFAHASFTMGRMYSRGYGSISFRTSGTASAGQDELGNNGHVAGRDALAPRPSAPNTPGVFSLRRNISSPRLVHDGGEPSPSVNAELDPQALATTTFGELLFAPWAYMCECAPPDMEAHTTSHQSAMAARHSSSMQPLPQQLLQQLPAQAPLGWGAYVVQHGLRIRMGMHVGGHDLQPSHISRREARLGGRTVYSGRCVILAKALADSTTGGLITASTAAVAKLAAAGMLGAKTGCVAMYEGEYELHETLPSQHVYQLVPHTLVGRAAAAYLGGVLPLRTRAVMPGVALAPAGFVAVAQVRLSGARTLGSLSAPMADAVDSVLLSVCRGVLRWQASCLEQQATEQGHLDFNAPTAGAATSKNGQQHQDGAGHEVLVGGTPTPVTRPVGQGGPPAKGGLRHAGLLISARAGSVTAVFSNVRQATHWAMVVCGALPARFDKLMSAVQPAAATGGPHQPNPMSSAAAGSVGPGSNGAATAAPRPPQAHQAEGPSSQSGEPSVLMGSPWVRASLAGDKPVPTPPTFPAAPEHHTADAAPQDTSGPLGQQSGTASGTGPASSAGYPMHFHQHMQPPSPSAASLPSHSHFSGLPSTMHSGQPSSDPSSPPDASTGLPGIGWSGGTAGASGDTGLRPPHADHSMTQRSAWTREAEIPAPLARKSGHHQHHRSLTSVSLSQAHLGTSAGQLSRLHVVSMGGDDPMQSLKAAATGQGANQEGDLMLSLPMPPSKTRLLSYTSATREALCLTADTRGAALASAQQPDLTAAQLLDPATSVLTCSHQLPPALVPGPQQRVPSDVATAGALVASDTEQTGVKMREVNSTTLPSAPVSSSQPLAKALRKLRPRGLVHAGNCQPVLLAASGFLQYSRPQQGSNASVVSELQGLIACVPQGAVCISQAAQDAWEVQRQQAPAPWTPLTHADRADPAPSMPNQERQTIRSASSGRKAAADASMSRDIAQRQREGMRCVGGSGQQQQQQPPSPLVAAQRQPSVSELKTKGDNHDGSATGAAEGLVVTPPPSPHVLDRLLVVGDRVPQPRKLGHFQQRAAPDTLRRVMWAPKPYQ